VSSLPKTVTRQHRDCNLNPGPSTPEFIKLTTPLLSHHKVYNATNKQTTESISHVDILNKLQHNVSAKCIMSISNTSDRLGVRIRRNAANVFHRHISDVNEIGQIHRPQAHTYNSH